MNSAALLPHALHLAPLYSTNHPPSTHLRPRREALDQGKPGPVVGNAARTEKPSCLHLPPPGPWGEGQPPWAPGAGTRSGGTSMGSGVNSVEPSGSSSRSTENEEPGRRTEMRSTATRRRARGAKRVGGST